MTKFLFPEMSLLEMCEEFDCDRQTILRREQGGLIPARCSPPHCKVYWDREHIELWKLWGRPRRPQFVSRLKKFAKDKERHLAAR